MTMADILVDVLDNLVITYYHLASMSFELLGILITKDIHLVTIYHTH
jgi:hypothetical protein